MAKFVKAPRLGESNGGYLGGFAADWKTTGMLRFVRKRKAVA